MFSYEKQFSLMKTILKTWVSRGNFSQYSIWCIIGPDYPIQQIITYEEFHRENGDLFFLKFYYEHRKME
jgi:hypothetical protein